jgi:hypothetical protein
MSTSDEDRDAVLTNPGLISGAREFRPTCDDREVGDGGRQGPQPVDVLLLANRFESCAA